MTERKKILHLIPRFSFGGAEMLLLEQVRRLDRSKYEIRVAAVRDGGDLEKYFKEAGVEIFSILPKRDGGIWWQWSALKKYVRDYNPDLIHSHIFSSDIYGLLLRRLVAPKAKWISTQHNVEFNTSWPRRLAWNFILPQADRVIAVSRAVYDYTHEYFGVLKDKIDLLPNGVVLEKWLSVPELKFMSKKKLHLATIGRLESQKGHRYLVEALSMLKDLDWHWDIYGEGSLAVYLQEKLKKYGLEKRVSWHGAEGGIEEKMKEIDIIIQPSLWEGRSLVVMEAMAAGRLLIATTEAGKELVEHGENGHLVPVKDAVELAKVIRYYSDHSTEAERLAHNARVYARDHFDLKDNVIGLEEIYDEFFSS
jgi:glycosyltransferase involved in cell wall biosynthesis